MNILMQVLRINLDSHESVFILCCTVPSLMEKILCVLAPLHTDFFLFAALVSSEPGPCPELYSLRELFLACLCIFSKISFP